MRVLITGHLGYIGTVLVPMLLENNHDVVGFDSDLYERCSYSDGIVEVPNIKKDIRDAEEQDLLGFDAIIHLAALSNDPLGDLNAEVTYEINHHGTVNLAKLAKKAGVKRFLFSSSCSTYGAAGDALLTEEAVFNPVTPYGRSKVLAEQDLGELADANFSPVYLRNATAYGVSPRLRFDLVLNNLVAWAFTTGAVRLKSDGTPWRPLVHIEDIAHAFIVMLEAPQNLIHNEAFNVGRSEENYRIRELAEIVKATVPGTEISFADDAGPDKRDYRVDCSRVKRILPDFKPKWTARRAAGQLYDSYRKIGFKLEEFEGERFRRVDHIKYLISNGYLDKSLRFRAGESAAGEA